MLKNIRNLFKWSPRKEVANTKCKTQLVQSMIKLLEILLLWENMWLSLGFIIYLNVLFFICLYKEINLLQLVIGIYFVLVSMDAFETWLKYKRRNSFLKKIIPQDDSVKLYQAAVRTQIWIKKKWSHYVILRETNHTKAFLLTNIVLGIIYIVGRTISGYAVMYILFTSAMLAQPALPYIKRAIKKAQQHAESDSEIESLIPVVTEQEMNDLTFEVDGAADKQKSIDYWKLDDLQPEETSDSSDNNSSTTNISKEAAKMLDKDVDTSSSNSSDDEYIPIVQRERTPLTPRQAVVEPDTWSSSAYSMFRNMTGVLGGMMYSQAPPKTQRLSSLDSDGFELIDEDEFN